MGLAGKFGQSQLTQVETRHSIILRNQDTFWKYVPCQSEYFRVLAIYTMLKPCNPVHLTLPSDIIYPTITMSFFVFPVQLLPLTQDEVKCCLYDIVTKTATALHELHTLGFVHLDVRLPNICFAMNMSGVIVKLIDLDRLIKITILVVIMEKCTRHLLMFTGPQTSMTGSSLG